MKKILYLMLTVFCVVCLSGCGKKYTVSFDTDGGTKVEEIKVKKNATIEVLPTTTKDGYTFIEWQLNGKTFDKSTKITSDITLKASWQKNAEPTVEVKKYKVTFNTDGGSKIESVEVEENKTLEKPENPTKKGYTFDKWMLNNKEYDFDTKVTKDITLKATWKREETKPAEEVKYTVKFDSNGGINVASQTVVKGNKVTKPANPTRSGYTFIEWQLDGKAYNFNSTVTKNITLKATWKKIEETKPAEEVKYPVKFDSNGGSSVANQTIVKGNKVTKPADPTRSGYTFVGWTLNGSSYDFNTPVNGDITLKANWKEVVVAKTYTATIETVDPYSPDRYITIKENGVAIKIAKLMYTDNVEIICAINGTKISVAYADINGESSFKVQLLDGSIVTAKVG